MRWLWFAIQWGATPMIVDAYVPAVSERIGYQVLSGAWHARRSAVIGSRPRIGGVARDQDRTVVRYAIESHLKPPVRQSAIMVVDRGKWRIVHDTFSEEALAVHAVAAAKGSGASPSEAVRRGEEARSRFRRIAETWVLSGAATSSRRLSRALP